MKIAKRIASVILWVFAVVFLVYAVWTFVSGTSVVGSAIAGGQITVKDNFYDIYNYYMTSPGSSGFTLNALYFACGLLMAGLGLSLWGCKCPTAVATEVITVSEIADDGDDDQAEGMPVAEDMPAAAEQQAEMAKEVVLDEVPEEKSAE